MKQFDHQIAARFQLLKGEFQSQLRQHHGAGLIHRGVTRDIGGHIAHYKVDGSVI